jgi:hypothetical protein
MWWDDTRMLCFAIRRYAQHVKAAVATRTKDTVTGPMSRKSISLKKNVAPQPTPSTAIIVQSLSICAIRPQYAALIALKTLRTKGKTCQSHTTIAIDRFKRSR